MKAKCISLSYIPGSYSISQGVKGGGTPGCSYYRNGAYHEMQGFGWQKDVAPSRLILTVQHKHGYSEIYVDRFFKDTVGRLTEKRRGKLKRAMPEEIEIHRNGGNSFFQADEKDLYAWKDRAGL